MKKNHFILLLLFVLFFNVCPMYSSVQSSPYYLLKIDKNVVDNDDWDEIELWILTGGNPDKPRILQSLPLSEPISLYQNDQNLKVNITWDEKVSIKVVNLETSMPVYMRQYTPGGSNEMMIETSGWTSGYYEVVFTNSAGETIAKGTVYIH